MLVDALAYPVLHLSDHFVELLHDGLALERLNGVALGRGGQDDERHNGDGAAGLLHAHARPDELDPTHQSLFASRTSSDGRGGMETCSPTAPDVVAPSMSDPPRKHTR